MMIIGMVMHKVVDFQSVRFTYRLKSHAIEMIPFAGGPCMSKSVGPVYVSRDLMHSDFFGVNTFLKPQLSSGKMLYLPTPKSLHRSMRSRTIAHNM